MTFPIYGKSKNSCSKPPTRKPHVSGQIPVSFFTDLLIGFLQMDRDIPNVLVSRIHDHQATNVLNTAHVDMSQKPCTTPTDSWCSWMTFTHSCPLVFEILCHTFVPTRIPQKKKVLTTGGRWILGQKPM